MRTPSLAQAMGEAYEALMVQMRELDVIGQISGLLGWDQEVMMPPPKLQQ